MFYSCQEQGSHDRGEGDGGHNGGRVRGCGRKRGTAHMRHGRVHQTPPRWSSRERQHPEWLRHGGGGRKSPRPYVPPPVPLQRVGLTTPPLPPGQELPAS